MILCLWNICLKILWEFVLITANNSGILLGPILVHKDVTPTSALKMLFNHLAILLVFFTIREYRHLDFVLERSATRQFTQAIFEKFKLFNFIKRFSLPIRVLLIRSNLSLVIRVLDECKVIAHFQSYLEKRWRQVSLDGIGVTFENVNDVAVYLGCSILDSMLRPEHVSFILVTKYLIISPENNAVTESKMHLAEIDVNFVAKVLTFANQELRATWKQYCSTSCII